MTSSPSAPRSAIDYDAIDEEDLRKNAVNISILRASAFPEPIAALKSGITNIRHSEISENFVRTLGHSTTAADGTLKKIIQLTWRYKGKSSHEDFRIVAAGRYDVVLGEDACLKLADVGRRIQPLMIDSGDPEERAKRRAQRAQIRLQQEQERERERQEKRQVLLQQQGAITSSL